MKFLMDVGLRPQFLRGHPQFLATGPLHRVAHNMAAGFAYGERLKREREKTPKIEAQVFFQLNLSGDISSLLPYAIGHTDQRVCRPLGRDHWSHLGSGLP